jgi:hypothetical protein
VADPEQDPEKHAALILVAQALEGMVWAGTFCESWIKSVAKKGKG